ncbi:MAG: DUF445 family protein [Spirochaetaceae bacterium]|jgi:uncharacterized membrane protein YheB (UPF0754 family)|nr:DUF445 family protein [Spirochaetaceae bacterium]
MKVLFICIVTPIAGAAIGYVTNFIAVKMLFRPLKELHIFKMHIPFTPGLIPRNRHELSESIACMVERELLSPDTIMERCKTPEFKNKFKETLLHITENILEHYMLKFDQTAFAGKNIFSFFTDSLENIRNTVSKAMLESLKKYILSEKHIDELYDHVLKEIPHITESLDIKRTVRSRIDSMDMINVERLILNILSGQLKWINIFGAMLGFMIGALEAFITIIML